MMGKVSFPAATSNKGQSQLSQTVKSRLGPVCFVLNYFFLGGVSFREGTLQWWGVDMEIERWVGLGCMMWNSQSINKVLCHFFKKRSSRLNHSFVYLKSLTFDNNDLSHFYTKASCTISDKFPKPFFIYRSIWPLLILCLSACLQRDLS